MSFIDAVKKVFSNYATFSGRARRSEFWYFVLFNCLVTAVLSTLGSFVGGEKNIFTILSSIYEIAVLVPNLAVTSRRLHDMGKSFTNYLFVLIPIVGWIMLIVWECKDSQPGENAYGPNPKETVVI